MSRQHQYQSYFSTAHYTLYARLGAADRSAFVPQPLRYVSGSSLARVKPGDVLWLVNVHQNDLYLLGHLQVALLVGDVDVAQSLVDLEAGQEMDEWFAIANAYQVEPTRLQQITAAAEHLAFHSRSQAAHQLTIEDGRLVKPQEILGLRQLTDESARMIETLWYDDSYVPQTVSDYLELTEDDQAYAEGRMTVRTVKQRQRNQRLVQDKKLRFARSQGHLYCEVCGFDFAAVYGADYIEVHHTRPLALLEEDEQYTQLDSLRLLCANCHRVAHLRTPPYTIEELKTLIESNRG